MIDLRNTIAHILEHRQHLVGVNEATTQQYVVLPILRALGWDDTNLASMEVLPEYAVENGNVDYALKAGQEPKLFIECKKWGEPIEKHKDQIVNYALKAGAAIIVGLTNGKMRHLYFSWVEGVPVSERIFCKIDIEDRENAVADLEKYLLKSNVASGEAELNAEIALEEKEKTNISEISPIVPNPNPIDDAIDNPSEKRPIAVLPKPDSEWTIEWVRNSLSQELRAHYEKIYSEESLKLFYGAVTGVQNLIETEKWRLNLPKVSKMLCGFWLTDKGVIGRIGRIFGILPSGRFPVSIVDRDGELIKKVQVLPRIFVRITKEEAEQLEREHNGCEYYGVSEDQSADYVYYDIPENISELLPVLEFAYNKHLGN